MKRIILHFMLGALPFLSFAQTTHTITTPGFAFSPNTLTVGIGDQITFNVSNIHTATQVSKATWLANGNTPLPSGFDINAASSNKTITVTTSDTIYYVCSPHAIGGMKGFVAVQTPLGIENAAVSVLSLGLKVYPNPAKTTVTIELPQATMIQSVSVLNAQGKEVLNNVVNASVASYGLNVETLNAGLYQVVIHTGDKKVVSKIIVE